MGLVVMLGVLTMLTPVARAQVSGPQYTVQSGDTLFDIALRFGVTLEALVAANPGLDANALAVGQSLTLPGFDDLTGDLNTHTLEPGESLDSLALRFGLSRETLIKLNRLINPERLYLNQAIIIVENAGERLAVPTGAMYAAPTGLLFLAASRNQNPWAVTAVNRLPNPNTLPPGGWAIIPGGDQATRAMPALFGDMRLSVLPPVQGRTLVIRLAPQQPLTLSGTLGDWPLHFNTEPVDSTFNYALLGINRLAESNLYPLTLVATDPAGHTTRFAQALPVRAGDYGVDPPLTVDPATIDPAVTMPETEQIKAIVSANTPTRYWQGLFALPSVGVIRSYFGSLRSYNGGPYDSFHGGVDFTGGEDRPITAPAPGVVVFTGALTVRGNATLIDHGWGVYTGYWHQSAIQVQVGQHVSAGDIIGFNGATGRVTGPHLHWEMWVGGFQVDPLEWTETAFP